VYTPAIEALCGVYGMSALGFVHDDGGRAAAGFKGATGDCTCRAIAIATGKPYLEVYEALNALGATERKSKRQIGKSNARTGVYKPTIRRYLAALGWQWHPTMQIGSGTTVHLRAEELPAGRLIVSVSGHTTTMIHGVIRDTHDPRRGATRYFGYDGKPDRIVPETRCVYGYWTRA
jgi:hypothetical protein